MLIDEKTSKDLDTLYGQMFNLNSMTDCMSSYLLNVWAMPQAANIIHHNLAHLFPLIADKISEIKDNYNIRSIRPAVPQHDEEFTNLVDMFDLLYNECEYTYEMIKLVNKGALENGDLNVHSDLMAILRDFNIVIGQVMTLKDKAHELVDKFDTFDSRIKKWGINGLGY